MKQGTKHPTRRYLICAGEKVRIKQQCWDTGNYRMITRVKYTQRGNEQYFICIIDGEEWNFPMDSVNPIAYYHSQIPADWRG